MELPNDIPTVMRNAMTYFMDHGNQIPEYQKQKIIGLMGPGVSPVDFVVKISETLYAVSDELEEEGREIAAQAANLASIYGWHGMTERGQKMVNALRRKNGEEIAQPDDEDPEPLEEALEPIRPITPPPRPLPSGPPEDLREQK